MENVKLAATASAPIGGDEHGYSKFLKEIQEAFSETIKERNRNFFTTNAADLFTLFLDNLPAEHRQRYTCHACKHFVNTFGGLVTIDENGKTHAAIWPETVEPFFAPSVKAIKKAVESARVTGVFFDERRVWGEPKTGEWTHMAVLGAPVFKASSLKNATQAMAEKAEDFKMLVAGLVEFSREVVNQAVRLLKSEALYRSERVLGVAEFLLNLHEARKGIKNSKARENLVWLAVANAPAGFCHIKSSMIGTLLEDIAAGMSFDNVKTRFDDKMNPAKYQRPQEDPKAGAIAEAEKIVAKLGIAESFKRRFARVEEVDALWRPTAEKEGLASEGVFSKVKAKNKSAKLDEMVLPAKIITWDKFSRTVLPEAKKVDLMVPGIGNFSAILTAVDYDAPPIIQWDSLDRRNPFSQYVYRGGSTASNWQLRAYEYCPVTAICKNPPHWFGCESKNHGEALIFILKGAKDYTEAGRALFPEILKSELHGIRSVIEAYSRCGTLEDREEASACGLKLEKGNSWGHKIRVTTKEGRQEYILDRWD